MNPLAAGMEEQQRAFDAFRRLYNCERPHEALGQVPPAALYAPSPRPYPRKLTSPEYGADIAVRRVGGNGRSSGRAGACS